MKARKRLDAITQSAHEKMQDEVSALLGKTLKFAPPTSRIVSKEDYFADLVGKYVFAKLDIQGDFEGIGGLLVSLKDAIRIGGTLIMLPDAELDEAEANGDYSSDTEDSYGEIANIIAGSFTSTFEEQYVKSIRFVRTAQEIVIPVKVEDESDEPCPDIEYYHLSSAMDLDGVEMGEIHFLLPGELFGVVEKTEKKKTESVEQAATVEKQEAVDSKEQVGVVESASDGSEAKGSTGVVEKQVAAGDISKPEAVGVVESQNAGNQENAPGTSASGNQASDTPGDTEDNKAAEKPKIDVKKQKKRIDSILKACCEKMAEETSALLGVEYKLENFEHTVASKEDCLDELSGKQVMARMDVRGTEDAESLVFCKIKDAILLGGKLIMLPDSELDKAMSEEDFNEDSQDAYGEIANILAGVYTAVFEEQYRKSIGFVKTAIETVVPVKIDPDTDDAFVNQMYCHALVTMTLDEKELGRLHTLFPARIFQLETFGQPEPQEENATEESKATLSGAAKTSGQNTVQAGETGTDVLIVTENDTESQAITTLLENKGYAALVLHFSDDVNMYLPGNVGMVFLVMNEIDEKGLSVAIKIRSAGGNGMPMIIAGPAWTRSKVLKAVKYGADDILITPAQSTDIEEKIQANLQQKAA